MKAIRRTDGSFEFDGTFDEIMRLAGIRGGDSEPKKDRATGDDLPTRIKAIMSASPTKEFPVDEIMKALGEPKDQYANVTGCLSRLSNPKKKVHCLTRSGRGVYRWGKE